MLESLPRQWSSKMATSCAQTGMRRNRRKAAPTSIVLPDRQFLISPEKRTWRSCFREAVSSRGSRDSGVVFSDQDALLSPCDSGFYSSVRTSKQGHSTNGSPWAWPFETRSDLISPRVNSSEAWPFSRRSSGFHSASLLPTKQNATSTPNRHRSSSLCKATQIKEQKIEDIVARLCARARISMNFVEAAGGSKSSSRSRRSSMQTSSSFTTSANSSLTSLNSITKRSRDADDEEDEFSDEKDRRGKKFRDQSPSKEPVPCRLFACPFAKYEPSRYSHQNMTELDYRHCSAGYWPTIARLKQHLYRTHDRSQLCCTRCWQSFTNVGAHQKHIESSKCEIREMPHEKMDLEKYNLVKERSNGDSVLLWYKIFEILFPNAERPFSPYAELVIGADMRALFQYIQERLPILLRRNVAERFEDLRHDDGNAEAVLETVLDDSLSEALQIVGTEFAEPRGMQHIFSSSSTSAPNTNLQHETVTTDIAAAQSSGIPLRPRLTRLPTVVSVLSESTIVPSNDPFTTNNQSFRLSGAAQPSDANLFDPNNELSFEPYDQDVNMGLWEPEMWQATNTSTYQHANAIPIDSQLHFPRFNEPDRPEFPFPHSDPSSTSSSMYFEERSIPMAYDDSNVVMNIADRGQYQVQSQTPESAGANFNNQHIPQQHFNSSPSYNIEEFNSHSDVTGMQLFF